MLGEERHSYAVSPNPNIDALWDSSATWTPFAANSMMGGPHCLSLKNRLFTTVPCTRDAPATWTTKPSKFCCRRMISFLLPPHDGPTLPTTDGLESLSLTLSLSLSLSHSLSHSFSHFQLCQSRRTQYKTLTQPPLHVSQPSAKKGCLLPFRPPPWVTVRERVGHVRHDTGQRCTLSSPKKTQTRTRL